MNLYQYAYRRSHSAEDAVIDAMSWSVDKISNGELASIMAINLIKAFDTVDQDFLLEKVSRFGVPPLIRPPPRPHW